MSARCTCNQDERAHHHGFGGTYPCEGPVDCIPCQPAGRQANGRDNIETRVTEAIQAGLRYITDRYGQSRHLWSEHWYDDGRENGPHSSDPR